MSKITLNNVGSLLDATTAATTINNNSAVIVTAYDNTLSRDGTSPNQMGASLDMNSNKILNLPAPLSDAEPVRKKEFDSLIINGGGIVSVNGKTGVVVLSTDDVSDTPTHKYTNSTDITRLANTSGTNTGDQTSITGNAGTATKLQVARAINGVNFDGTIDITVSDNTKVPSTRLVNTYPLSTDITLTKSDVGLGNVNNITALAVIKNQFFTASGTYTPDPNLIYAVIECVGGGGGGGGCQGNASGTAQGGGGGSGGYSKKFASKSTIGASQTVTIGSAGAAGVGTNNVQAGNGGDTSVGTLCIGKGGSGGFGGYSAGTIGAGGPGGIAGTGDVTIPGEYGGRGFWASINTVNLSTAYGGRSYFGSQAESPNPGGSVVTNGATGGLYGGGGSGGIVQVSTSNATGGAGAAGVVVITEFCSQ